MIRTEDDPTAEAETTIENEDAKEETKNSANGMLQCYNKKIVTTEEGKIAEKTTPDEQITNA